MESRKRKRKYCKHCDSWLAKSTYYLHRKLFYDSQSKVWRKEIEAPSTYTDTSSESDVDVEDENCVGEIEIDGREQLSSDNCDEDETLESQGDLRST